MASLRELCPVIYGPVQSRRHGLSLGINLGDPKDKACTWSCIYCQCGYGKRVTSSDSRTLPSVAQVMDELLPALKMHPTLDSVTLAGNTEPTAHPDFCEIVERVLALRKEQNAKWIFNVLSNGSELNKEFVRKGCDLLDEVWIKLDCATDDLFRRLNRPCEGVGSVAEHIARIQLLKAPRIQSLFWNNPAKPEQGNWTHANRLAYLDAVKQIRPTQLFMTTLQREPATPELEPVNGLELEDFARQVRLAGFDVRVFV